MNKKEQFKKELRELLEKYDALVGVNLEGDTHGLYCALFIEIRGEGKIVFDNPPFIEKGDLK